MTLSFTQHINGKPNYFIEKIWQSISPNSNRVDEYIEYTAYHNRQFKKLWDLLADYKPKLHTIRLDPHNRWRAGMKIHPVINNRTPNRFQFAPILECMSVQTIEVKNVGHLPPLNHGIVISCPIKEVIFHLAYTVAIDGRQLNSEEIKQLAINDGFDNADDFFAYFNKDFTGKIIHWTETKY